MRGISGRVGFGEFDLDLDTGELRKSGVLLKLRPQPASVLCLLVTHAGDLVGREEIRRLLWGDSTFVDYDVGVDRCVSGIRSVLCDQAHAPRYIETLPRRGYRFIAPIRRQRPFAEPTLAVLPFANLNDDPTKEYFADGITDALITELARIPALRVISRQSVLHLKGSSRKLREIAADLRVDGVIEGAALHEGSRVRLTAQLILMDPERHVWAQSYDCDLSAVLTTQREVAHAIAGCVATLFRSGDATAPAAVPAPSVPPEIVEIYLKARIEFEKMSADGIGKALDYFRELTVKAPDFVLGLVGHATCLFCLGFWGHAPNCEVYPSAKQLALRAVAADDGNARAHQTLGWMHLLLDRDMAASERQFRRAIELSPSDSDTHISYASFLLGAGRYPEAIAEARYALSLNPNSLLPSQATAWFYLHAGQYAEAEAQARQAIASFPDSLQPQFVLGWTAWRAGRSEEAIAAFEKALRLSREALSLSFLGHLYGRVGRRDEAASLLRELDRLFAKGQAPPIAFVIIHAGLGDTAAAFDWLETACRLGCDMHYLTKGFPGIDPLRSDPRYADLARRMGVVPA